ncbi:MAG TPA: 3'-5' exonuclease, partial [Candidatus Diapherotrites archaeon]|nr:3'-5' exonuclease [Candidatus Diapherotrites archaeon]
VIQSIWGEDEEKILKKTSEILDKVNQSGYILSGAGILRFDMPWLAKRMMINGIAPPKNINVFGKKPWEIDVYDIQQVWGQGAYQESFTPLEIISVSLGIPSSKSDLSGSKVKDAYWNGEIIRIKEYCELDVKSTMECAFRLIDLS